MRALLLLALFAGCERTSALYCKNNPEKCTSPGIDAPIAPPGCTGDDACKAIDPALPYCIGMMACGACRTSADCAEPTGVCDPATNACRGCMANSECPSQVCVEASGACASADQVAYVGGTGSSMTCTITAPCATLELALALPMRPQFIKLVDDVTEPGPVTFDGGAPIALLGTSHVIRTTGQGIILANAADLSITNVEITPVAADGNISDDCIYLASGTPTLHLTASKIHGCGGDNVNINAGTAVIDTSELHDSLYGVEVLNGATATISRTIIHHNTYVGLNVNTVSTTPTTVDRSVIAYNGSVGEPGMDVTGDVVVVNTIISHNGSNSGSIGGVRINSGNSSFEYVTISDNTSGVSPNHGMSCVPTATASLKNSIMTGNAPSIEAGCAPTYTLLDLASSTTSNRTGDPAFIANIMDPTDPHFYRLQSTSAAIGGALPDPNVPKDIDGDSRDSNHPDMGADEHN